ncbi:hypothetical protein F7725_017858 [Dissostichus mawsoni]|uniref:Uncharacterized protein n=1 Tax=Dissostichus mawsoni TaxID=36200 RepID=A0A7J5XQC7_DISMA|nr:hypothetical protein F7725_017858 [Dissostichus mawsoni]
MQMLHLQLELFRVGEENDVLADVLALSGEEVQRRVRGDDGVSHAAVRQPPRAAEVQAVAPGGVELSRGDQLRPVTQAECLRLPEGEALRGGVMEHLTCTQGESVPLTFDLDLGEGVGVLQALRHFAAVEPGVVVLQALQPQREVCRGRGVVRQRGPVPERLADPHPVPPRHQDLRLVALSQDAPFDPGQRQHGVAPVGGGGGRGGQGHQAGQRQGAAQHRRHRGGEGMLTCRS